MADLVDRAQAREHELLEEARARVTAELRAGPGREFCGDCGDRIPAARRRAVPACTLCTSCQEYLERRTARRG